MMFKILVIQATNNLSDERAEFLINDLLTYPGWSNLPAVRADRVYAVNANSYFARPGPRVIEGTDLLAHILHPDLFDWNGPAGAFCRLTQGPIQL
jgi:iron complex transport system substrate-binding protein